MKLNEQINFQYLKEDFIIKKTGHLYDYRYEHSKYYRDENISDENYIEIFKKAISRGIRGYNNKLVVMSLKNYNNVWVHVLATVQDNTFKIISVYCTKKNDFWKAFIKVNNRIYLASYYVIPKMDTATRYQKTHKKIKYEVEKYCRTQDSTFRQYMDFSGIKKLSN